MSIDYDLGIRKMITDQEKSIQIAIGINVGRHGVYFFFYSLRKRYDRMAATFYLLDFWLAVG